MTSRLPNEQPQLGGRTSMLFTGGTLASRTLGFLRTIAIGFCLGTGVVGDAYNVSNQLPNTIFLFLGGSAIASVLTPLLISALHRSRGDAEKLAATMLLLGAAISAVMVGILCAAAPALARAVAADAWSDAQASLATTLSYWCLPQILFLTVFTVLSQVAQANNQFVVAAWAPAAGNVVVILAAIAVGLSGSVSGQDPSSLGGVPLFALGASTLGASALQATIVYLSVRRSRFRFRVPRSLRGLGLRVAARVGGTAIVASAGFQVANIMAMAVTTRAGAKAEDMGVSGRGYSGFFFAQTSTLAVQAVLATGIATMSLASVSHFVARSNHAAAAVALEDAVTRTLGVILPFAVTLVPLGQALTVLVLSRGETSDADAVYAGQVLSVMALALVPYSLQIVLLRPHYALARTRAPLVNSLVATSVWISGTLVSAFLLPPQTVTIGCAAAFAIAYWIDLPLVLLLLRRTTLTPANSVLRLRVIRASVTTCVSSAVGLAIAMQAPTSILLAVTGAAISLLMHIVINWRSPISVSNTIRWLLRH